MSKVKHYAREGYVALALTVGASVEKDDIIQVGSEGLIGFVLTDRATTATIAAGTAAQGLANGEATVALPGVGLVVERPNVGGVSAVGEKAYVNSSGNYTSSASGNTFVGHFLSTGSSGADVLIGLVQGGV